MMFTLDEHMFDSDVINCESHLSMRYTEVAHRLSQVTEQHIPKYAFGAMDRDPITRECVTVPNEPDFSISSLPLEGPCDMMGYVVDLLIFYIMYL